ncbi:MAG: HAMP domain-containing histidine kinase [Flavobacteriales bacterium]|jgi:signal transduction histidine kinase|nr:HAMP domain-containing histidine kinase [Flavobacteriales bacterium]
MKLLNRSLLHVSLALLLVLALWAVAFFFVMREAVRHSIDEGLDDQVEVITHRLKSDRSLLYVHDLGLHGFAIAPAATKEKVRYTDTLLYVPSEGEAERVRLRTGTFEYEGGDHRIQVYTSTVEEDDLVETMAWALIALYTLLLLTIVLVNNVVLRRLWKPFQTMLAQLKSFRLGTARELAPVPTRISEFNELHAAANLLVRRAADAYADQRAFTANAAHELQTPLAIAINKLELLAEQGGSEEERMIALGEVIAVLERLTRLNKSLLLLARIENRQFPDEQEISLATIAKEVMDEFADLAEHRSVALRLEGSGDLVRSMDPALARILVTNLLKNAIVHNERGGSVTVQVEPGRLTVRNTGHTPLDAQRIFTRFHKETTADGGTGLGLAIAKAIADLYGLQVRYRFEDGHVMELVIG